MTERHLAHFNWGLLKAPIGDPRVAPFIDAVDKVNAKAEAAPGFVWRSGNEAEYARQIGWDLFTENEGRIIASFSVWETPEALHEFVYNTVHGAFLNRRAEWFEAAETINYALWWVPVGHVPEFYEARDRVESLRAHGPSDWAFVFDTANGIGDS